MQPGPRKVHHHPLHLRRLKLHICLFAKFSAVRQHTNTRFSAFSKGTEEVSVYPNNPAVIIIAAIRISRILLQESLRIPQIGRINNAVIENKPMIIPAIESLIPLSVRKVDNNVEIM